MGLIFNRQKEKKQKSCVHTQTAPVLDQRGQSTEEAKESAGGIPLTDIVEVDTIASNEKPPTKDVTEERCQICREEQLAARRYRIRLILGLFFPFTLQALDVTIIASALTWIASDFHQMSQMNWIISAFNLTSCAFIPFWGQMADIFGRTATLEATILLMMLGSALCTAAPVDAFPMLILGRAIQGLSAAGIMVTIKVILADKVSLKENAKNTSIFSMFGGLSYALGPVIGGFLTDKNWRWCFGINLPVAFLGVILIFFVLRPQLLGPQPLPQLPDQETTNESAKRKERFKSRMSMIDFGGQFLFLAGIGLLILALTWGGAIYPWKSVHVITSLVLGGLLTLCFILWEYLMSPNRYLSKKFPLQNPTVPWELLSQRNIGLLFYINMATGMAMTAVLYFVDIYFVLVRSYGPSKAGIQLLYYTPGIGLGVYLAMYLCNIRPRQTFLPLFLGSFIEALGLTLLTYALHTSSTPLIYTMMGLTGAGTGLRFMPGSLHGIGFFPNKIANVIALMSFAIPFGITIGMTIMNTVFNNHFPSPSSSSHSPSSATANIINYIDTLPAEVQGLIREKAKKAIIWALISIMPLMWLCVLAAGLLGNVRITGLGREEGDWGRNVFQGVYLWELGGRRWRGKKDVSTAMG